MYDYIIIGAGSAGCVLAHRLTEDPLTRVLLVEAGGPDRRKEIHIPAAFSRLFKTEADWNFYTDPQPGLHGRKLYWPRGKVLGGSSSINAMIYMRGHAADYDGWAALGCDGWSYADVLPYFKKSEHNERGASAYHGVDGPLNVADQTDPNPLTNAFIRAAIDVGIPFNPDFNGAQQEGVGLNQVNIKRGVRHSTAAAFLKPIRYRPNLMIETGAHTTRIELEGKRAVGVAYVKDGQRIVARAEREVVLAAGAIGSPHLLMLSGIGPADHLKQHAIPVVLDAPGVGQNLQDHLITGVMRRSTQPITLMNAEKPASLARYLLFRRGGLTSNVAEACAFTHTRDGLEAPDVQFHFGPVAFTNHNLGGITEHAFTLGPLTLYPKSRGYLALRSNDPFAAPIIQPNYLSDEEGDDLRVLVEGLKLAREILAQAPFDPYRGDELQPDARVTTDAKIADYIRGNAETLYHPVGTCAMGTDAMAVVDPELRVRGIEGLRVADASIMPVIVRGNTHAPTVMIGEKAADLIRGIKPASAYARRTAVHA